MADRLECAGCVHAMGGDCGHTLPMPQTEMSVCPIGRFSTGSRMAVLSCHFNPCGYSKPVQNFQRFREELCVPKGTIVRVAELSYDGSFDVATEDSDLRIEGDPLRHGLWQKERLLNLAARSLPPEVDRIAWVDGDVIFDNPDWFEQAAVLLDHVPAVQLFDTAFWEGEGGRTRPSIGAGSLLGHQTHVTQFHPGYAWAAHRRAFPACWSVEGGGLYDRAPLGAGDSLMAFAWLDELERGGMFPQLAHREQQYVRNWASRVPRIRIGCVPGSVRHMWHGSRANRRYTERHATLRDCGYDPYLHIEPCPETGLLRWTVNAPEELMRFARELFALRREDG